MENYIRLDAAKLVKSLTTWAAQMFVFSILSIHSFETPTFFRYAVMPLGLQNAPAMFQLFVWITRLSWMTLRLILIVKMNIWWLYRCLNTSLIIKRCFIGRVHRCFKFMASKTRAKISIPRDASSVALPEMDMRSVWGCDEDEVKQVHS